MFTLSDRTRCCTTALEHKGPRLGEGSEPPCLFSQEDVQKTLRVTAKAMSAELQQLQRVCSHKLCATAA
jgi:hypothetical protein